MELVTLRPVGIILDRGWNPCLLHCRWILIYCATRVSCCVFWGAGNRFSSKLNYHNFFMFFIISLVWILFSYIVEEHFVQWLDDKVKA